MSAENFINWYAAKTNTEFIEAKNKLFAIRSGSPKLYEFLIDEFQGQGMPTPAPAQPRLSKYKTKMASSRNVPPVTNEDRLDWIRNNFQQVKKDVEQKLYMTKMASSSSASETYMASEKNICAKNGVQYLTDMDAEKNIAPADDDDFADDYEEEAPRVRYTTRMSSFGNIAKRG
jgi:hypothetical protein